MDGRMSGWTNGWMDDPNTVLLCHIKATHYANRGLKLLAADNSNLTGR
jgi:hypothetical protein